MRSVLALLLLAAPLSAQLETASLGSCPLELGGVIQDCQVAYAIYGELNESRSNAVLIPTWYTGRAANWSMLLGPAGAVDTTSHFVIVVESLGAGASSSPATSVSQAGAGFPELTIGDMVVASRRVSEEVLGLSHLHAVVGFSMGGFQAFEWAMRYPDYVDRIVPISGTPTQTGFQRAAWEELATATDEAARDPQPSEESLDRIARLLVMVLSSPEALVQRGYNADFQARRASLRTADLWEWAWQARAINRFDIGSDYGGDLQSAAARWDGEALVVVALHDHSVSVDPAVVFADYLSAETFVMPDLSGHAAIFGNAEARALVREFLAR